MNGEGITAEARRPISEELVQTDGQWRLVKRRPTTCGRLFRSGQVSAVLMTAFDGLVESTARARGIAVDDKDHASAKFISHCYDGMPASNGTALSESLFGQPTWPSTNPYALDAGEEVRWVAKRIPPEMRDLFCMCIEEELGAQSAYLTLTELGQRRGYQSTKQASASGGTQVFDMLAVVAQLRREFLASKRKGEVHPKSPRNWPEHLR